MSKRRLHTSVSNAVTHLTKEISAMSPEEVMSLHGIDFNSDGSIVDTTNNMTFATLTEWATFIIEQENADYYASLDEEIQNSYDDE